MKQEKVEKFAKKFPILTKLERINYHSSPQRYDFITKSNIMTNCISKVQHKKELKQLEDTSSERDSLKIIDLLDENQKLKEQLKRADNNYKDLREYYEHDRDLKEEFRKEVLKLKKELEDLKKYKDFAGKEYQKKQDELEDYKAKVLDIIDKMPVTLKVVLRLEEKLV